MISKEQIKEISSNPKCKLLAISDLTCWIGGPIEFLDKHTESESPFRYYDPL